MVKIGGEESSCWRGYSSGEARRDKDTKARSESIAVGRDVCSELFCYPSEGVSGKKTMGWLVECRYSEEHKHKEPVD
jgi:hypothetical protein